MSLVTFARWISMATLFMGLWFAAGLFLFATKVMAIRRVHNWWYYVWTGCRQHDKEIEIDISLLNEALFAEFLFESLPQMVVQSMNNTLTQLWNPIGIFSMCLSVAVMLNGLYRYGYYSFWLGYSIQNVPTEISIGGIKVSVENADDKDKLQEKSAHQGAVVDIESSKPAAMQELLIRLKYTDFLRKEVFAMRDSIARYISLGEFDEIGKLLDVVVADIEVIEALFSKFVSSNALKASSSSSSRRSNEARSSMLLKLNSASDAVMPSPGSNGRMTRTSLFGGHSGAKVAALNAFSKKSTVKAAFSHKRRSEKSSDSDSSSHSDSDGEGQGLQDQQTLRSPELVSHVSHTHKPSITVSSTPGVYDTAIASSPEHADSTYTRRPSIGELSLYNTVDSVPSVCDATGVEPVTVYKTASVDYSSVTDSSPSVYKTVDHHHHTEEEERLHQDTLAVEAKQEEAHEEEAHPSTTAVLSMSITHNSSQVVQKLLRSAMIANAKKYVAEGRWHDAVECYQKLILQCDSNLGNYTHLLYHILAHTYSLSSRPHAYYITGCGK